MGCDIHICTETKINDKWVMVRYLDYRDKATNRDYRRFAALAGVRGLGPEPRGLPDIGDSTRYWVDFWGVDGHSHSWLSMDDACQIFLQTSGVVDEYAQKYPQDDFFNVPEERSNLDDWRIVFWFDN